jgi:hypothetical protein
MVNVRRPNYRAARCAALAGCGRGADGANLSEAERAPWRKQARDWLRADLAGLLGSPGRLVTAGVLDRQAEGSSLYLGSDPGRRRGRP